MATPNWWDNNIEVMKMMMKIHRGVLLSEARLLIITNLLSIPNNNKKDVVLAISQLGGFVELFPLPR